MPTEDGRQSPRVPTSQPAGVGVIVAIQALNGRHRERRPAPGAEQVRQALWPAGALDQAAPASLRLAYSVVIAVSMSSRAACRAGPMLASTPAAPVAMM